MDEHLRARLIVILTLSVQIVFALLLAAIAQQSARGSITEVVKRKYVGPLLLAKLLLVLIEVALNVICILWIFYEVTHCPLQPFASTVIKSFLYISWIPIILILLAIYIAYDPLGKIRYEDLQTPEEREYYNRKSTQIWASRLQWTFWFFNDQKLSDAVGGMAALLSTLFRSTDLVLYDIIAGSILLRVRQKRETRIKRQSGNVDSVELNYSTDLHRIFGDVPPWMTIEEARNYLKLATAAYGWVYVLYRYYCSGLCFLTPYLRCCGFRPQNVNGDNCCMCNYAGVKLLSSMKDKAFIYVSFENHIFEVPFYVLAEHERKRIVVTVRGSTSLHDMFTDFTGPAEKFEAEGLPENTSAHKGMALSTERTLERLTPILESTFAEHPDYGLVITGHSLGAGVSILLGIKLKPKYPHLKVYAFSAPSGLLTREAARYTESFVMTVGVGDDLVMRISLNSAQTFRDRLIETIHMTRLPKYRILLKGLRYMICSIPETDLTSTWKTPEDIEANLMTPRLARSLSYEVERLYIAGRILHMVRHRPVGIDRSAKKHEPKYKAKWATAEEFNELVVMPRMLLDHLPENVMEPITKMIESRSNPSQ